jgi:putative Ca2+/H+ antiporter (TMEM165/GDT1 family)
MSDSAKLRAEASVVTTVTVLASAYVFGAIIGKMKTDKLKYHVVIVAGAVVIFFLAMRRWRRTAVVLTSQLDSESATPAPV